MINLFKSAPFKNIKLLLTGSILAQGIIFLFSPVLVRLYTPTELGTYSTILAIVTFFVPLIAGKLDYLIVPEKSEKKVNILLKLSVLLILVNSIIILFFVVIFNSLNIGIYKEEKWLLYIVPCIIFLNALNSVFMQYNNRLEQYKEISNITIKRSTVQITGQAFFGFFGLGTWGLIFSLLLSVLSGLFKQVKISIGSMKSLFPYNLKSTIKSLKEVKDYIKLSIPATILSSFSLNLTVPLITFQYSATISGYYYLASKVVALPVQLLGLTIGKVFFKNASVEYQKDSKINKSFYSTLLITICILSPISIIVYFLSYYLNILFGKSWIEAADIIRILIPFYLIRGITLSVILTPYVIKKVKMDFVNQLGILLSIISSFFIVRVNDLSYMDFFVIYSFLGSLVYLIILINCIRIERKLIRNLRMNVRDE